MSKVTKESFRNWLGQYTPTSKVGRNGVTPIEKYVTYHGASTAKLPAWTEKHSNLVRERKANTVTAKAALEILERV